MIDLIVFVIKCQKKNRTPNRSLLFTSKQNTAFHRAPATLIGGSRKKKSIRLFIFYIFLNNISFCSVSLYYKYIEMSAKCNYIFFVFNSTSFYK